MKKLLIVLSVFLLAGAGCAGVGGGTDVEQQEDLVSGDWWLVFDLPEGWAMYQHYQEDENPTELEITRELNDVVLQSTTSSIYEGEEEPAPEEAEAEGESEEPADTETETVEETETEEVSDYTYIRVFRYDSRTSVPADAEDLGDGFFKRVRDDGSVAYYYAGENGKYKFVLEQVSVELSEVERIITSSEEVTDL